MLAVALAASLGAAAADFGYMAFRQSDGTVATLPAMGLRMTFADGRLVAVNGSETLQLDAATLAAMYFSDSATTGIEAVGKAGSTVAVDGGDIVVSAAQGAAVSVYGVGGIRVAASQNADGGTLRIPVAKGAYIVNVNGTRTKILVK